MAHDTDVNDTLLRLRHCVIDGRYQLSDCGDNDAALEVLSDFVENFAELDQAITTYDVLPHDWREASA